MSCLLLFRSFVVVAAAGHSSDVAAAQSLAAAVADEVAVGAVSKLLVSELVKHMSLEPLVAVEIVTLSWIGHDGDDVMLQELGNRSDLSSQLTHRIITYLPRSVDRTQADRLSRLEQDTLVANRQRIGLWLVSSHRTLVSMVAADCGMVMALPKTTADLALVAGLDSLLSSASIYICYGIY